MNPILAANEVYVKLLSTSNSRIGIADNAQKNDEIISKLLELVGNGEEHRENLYWRYAELEN